MNPVVNRRVQSNRASKVFNQPKRRDKIDPLTQRYAIVSDQAYKSKGERRTHVKDAQSRWVLNEDYSNEEGVVYSNDEEVIVGFRGTAGANDIGTDALLALGQLRNSSRARRSEEWFDRLLQSELARDKTITVTGHSLGGALAHHIGNRHPKEVKRIVKFNAGSRVSTFSPFSLLFRKKDKRVEEHVVKGDPVSMFLHLESPNPVFHYKGKRGANAHTVRNFL